MLKFQYQKGENPQRIGKKFSGLQNGVIKELQIGAGFRNYKSRQEELQIRQFLNFQVRAKNYNLGRDFKSGQRDFKSRHRLQIEARGTLNRGRANLIFLLLAFL